MAFPDESYIYLIDLINRHVVSVILENPPASVPEISAPVGQVPQPMQIDEETQHVPQAITDLQSTLKRTLSEEVEAEPRHSKRRKVPDIQPNDQAPGILQAHSAETPSKSLANNEDPEIPSKQKKLRTRALAPRMAKAKAALNALSKAAKSAPSRTLKSNSKTKAKTLAASVLSPMPTTAVASTSKSNNELKARAMDAAMISPGGTITPSSESSQKDGESRLHQATIHLDAVQAPGPTGPPSLEPAAHPTADGSEEIYISGNDDGRKPKTLNLNTYKYHALGDVVSTIRLFGTTDSYSTQMPECFHRYPKRQYKRTNKKNVHRQLSRIQTRQARIRKLRKQLVPERGEGYQDDEASDLPYFIGKSENHPIGLSSFLQAKKDDPAVKDYIPKLKAHLLPRIRRRLLEEEEASKDKNEHRICLLHSLVEDPVVTPPATTLSSNLDPSSHIQDVDLIYIHSDRIYEHCILHINYTTYDVRQKTDIVNPKTSRRDVMCLQASDDENSREGPADAPDIPRHQFLHARVLGVYHVNIVYKGKGASDLRKRRFDFLWVRWYSFCERSPAKNAFDRLRLAPLDDPASVGFIDPEDVVRACHIIPRYSLGQCHAPLVKQPMQHLGKSRVRVETRIQSTLAKDYEDWHEYYANRFVDRDMLMRYHWGLGVGHVYSHQDAPEMELVPDGEPGESTKEIVPAEEFISTDSAPVIAQDTVKPTSELVEAQDTTVDDTLEDKEQAELEVAELVEDGEESDIEDWEAVGREIPEPDSEVEGEDF